MAVVRVEQLYPWPADQIADMLAGYERAEEVVWLQEEPENMGAWTFVRDRLRALVGNDFRFRKSPGWRRVRRPPAATPCTSSSRRTCWNGRWAGARRCRHPLQGGAFAPMLTASWSLGAIPGHA